MDRLNLTQIVDQARAMKPGTSKQIETQKMAGAEANSVRDKLGREYEVQATEDHELTITKLAVS